MAHPGLIRSVALVNMKIVSSFLLAGFYCRLLKIVYFLVFELYFALLTIKFNCLVLSISTSGAEKEDCSALDQLKCYNALTSTLSNMILKLAPDWPTTTTPVYT